MYDKFITWAFPPTPEYDTPKELSVDELGIWLTEVKGGDNIAGDYKWRILRLLKNQEKRIKKLEANRKELIK